MLSLIVVQQEVGMVTCPLHWLNNLKTDVQQEVVALDKFDCCATGG